MDALKTFATVLGPAWAVREAGVPDAPWITALDETAEAIAQRKLALDRRRQHEPMAAGGLFDEVAKAQGFLL